MAYDHSVKFKTRSEFVDFDNKNTTLSADTVSSAISEIDYDNHRSVTPYKPYLMAHGKNRNINVTYQQQTGGYLVLGDFVFFYAYLKGNIIEQGEYAAISMPPVYPRHANNHFLINLTTAFNCFTKLPSGTCSIEYVAAPAKPYITPWTERSSGNSLDFGAPILVWKTGTNQIVRVNGYYSLV